MFFYWKGNLVVSISQLTLFRRQIWREHQCYFKNFKGDFYQRPWKCQCNPLNIKTQTCHVHSRGEEWGRPKTDNCYNETMPISKEGHWGSGSDIRMMRIAEAAIEELKSRGLKVQMLNITHLSEYRKEAHPSTHRRQWVPLTEEQLSNPTSYADCVHWCLPGVPDVWNELLYAYIFYFS